MSAEISVHDNLIVSYTVDCQEQRITLRTAFDSNDLHEDTDVIFSGVVGYHFEGDNFGTILFDIAQVSPEEVYSAYRDVFERRKSYAWPTIDSGTEQELMDKLRNRNVKGFLISSSYGMEGFVLAEEMRLVALP